ncbi:efflux RND transporter permease subunit [Candidatus Contubernalis alkaliaceticus]|uniref:efflux RND transporter permease subunit n=1 Tax=Candidatus Contubernalis alkaliaceticus TaxID=338645 RepID=UPI001F4C0470|nr:efflux RND transporter permease subunit [Candidatus Contubernalis alkalaceticus]UNC92330.1 efflux RND transporter permease subunit [Candidatus Contubernalis alkalaceticus]
MSLTDLSVKRPIAVFMVVLIVLMLGVVSLTRLPVDLYPEMNFPVAVVITNYEGAGPYEIENMVTRPLEEAVSTVNNLESISSNSGAGSSMIVATFGWGTDMDFASLDLREKLDMVKGFLPDEVEDPLVFQFDPGMLPVLQVGISGDMDAVALNNLTQDVIKNRLERLDGVAVCEVSGGLSREVSVQLDPYKLSAYDVSLEQIIQVLRAENLTFSSGEIEEGARQYMVRTTGELTSIREMGELVVGASQTGPLFLRDLADIEEGFQEHQSLNRMNGEPTLSLSIRKQTDSNTVQVAERIKQELAVLEREMPGNIEFQMAFDQSEFIQESINNVAQVAVVGGILAVLILLLFLGNVTSTVIIGLSIPISIVATFAMMYFQNLTLNILTMAGLGLGIGMMVDNSIVILENIFRYRQKGKGREEAALRGSREVSGAIIAATLTTMVVFLPVIFTEGMASMIFSSLAWTVAFSLFASLIVALTIIPVLSSKILKASRKEEKKSLLYLPHQIWQRFMMRLSLFYGRALTRVLDYRWLMVVLLLALLSSSIFLIPYVGYEFLPPVDMGEIMVHIRLPVGSTLEETDRAVRHVEEILGEYPDIEAVFASVGSGGDFSGEAAPEKASLQLRLVDLGKRQLSTVQLTEQLRQQVQGMPGVEINVTEQDIAYGAMEGGAVNISVKGDDLEVLRTLTWEIAQRVARVEGTREIETSFSEGRPELRIKLDRERAGSLGISTYQVASAVRLALEGQVATRYRVGGEEVDVRVQTTNLHSHNMAALEQLTITTALGSTVPIGEVASITREVGPVQIQRDGQVRAANVTSQVFDRDIGRVSRDIERELEDMQMPLGYIWDFQGEQADMMQSFGDLTLALIMAILLVYMIMAAQFESLLYPFIIMFSLPQTFIGVMLALVITGRTLNASSFIGVIMLAGIVVNNGIVLVDYINILRRERNYARDDAIREAGTVRLRPIMMTTMTTILGMLPLALNIGEGTEALAPMATVIIGGLTVSSIMTLLLVPVVYAMMDDGGKWLARKLRQEKLEPGEVTAEQ